MTTPAPLVPDGPGWGRFAGALFAAGFATFVVIFSPQAVLPTLSAQLAVDADTAAATVSASTLGVAVGVLGWARVADRVGRIRAMRRSLAVGLLLAAVVPLLPSVPSILAVRFVGGVALAAVPAVGMAHIADRVDRSAAARAAGTFVAGNTIGGIVGRITAGAAADLGGWRSAFAATAVLAVVAGVAFVVLTGRPGPAPRSDGTARTVTAVATHLRDPAMLALFALGFLLMGAFGAVYSVIGYRLSGAPFGLSAAVTGSVFVVYLAGTVAARRSAVVAARLGERGALIAGAAAMLLAVPLLAVPSLPVAVLGLVVFTVGCFTAHPLASGLSGRTARTGRSQATALYQIAWLGGTSLFAWLAGVALTAAGWGAALAVVAAISALAGVVAWFSGATVGGGSGTAPAAIDSTPRRPRRGG